MLQPKPASQMNVTPPAGAVSVFQAMALVPSVARAISALRIEATGEGYVIVAPETVEA
jgi:hypothetical protein